MNSLGGYFGMELRKGNEYHKNAIRLNTARNALELILKNRKLKKVYIPYYTCDVILEPLHKLNLEYEFYSINKNFEPVFNYDAIKANEGFLYTNYFGLKDTFIASLTGIYKNLIIDNSQAFFALPQPGVSTYYSCRKFFGVPDGAYLYLDGVIEKGFPNDSSIERFSHLLKRIEYNAETGYEDFKANEIILQWQPIKKMSNLTKALLCNIDYNFVSQRRRQNFLTLHKSLIHLNKLKLNLDEQSVPMIYPLRLFRPNLKQHLIDKKIFVPTYWPEILKKNSDASIEYQFAKEIIHLPVDQRYDIKNMKYIIKVITET